MLLLCSRQLGKSHVPLHGVALNEAYLNDDALILLSSKTERQAGELFGKVAKFHKQLQLVETVRDMALTLELPMARGSSPCAVRATISGVLRPSPVRRGRGVNRIRSVLNAYFRCFWSAVGSSSLFPPLVESGGGSMRSG